MIRFRPFRQLPERPRPDLDPLRRLHVFEDRDRVAAQFQHPRHAAHPPVQLACRLDQIDQIALAPELLRARRVGEDHVRQPAERIRPIAHHLPTDRQREPLRRPILDHHDGRCGAGSAGCGIGFAGGQPRRSSSRSAQCRIAHSPLPMPDRPLHHPRQPPRIIRLPPRREPLHIDRRHRRTPRCLVPDDLERAIAQHRRIDRRVEIDRRQIVLRIDPRQRLLRPPRPLPRRRVGSIRRYRERHRLREEIADTLPHQRPRIIDRQPPLTGQRSPLPLTPLVKVEVFPTPRPIPPRPRIIPQYPAHQSPVPEHGTGGTETRRGSGEDE